MVNSDNIRIFAPMETKNNKNEKKEWVYKTERTLVDGLLAGKKDAQAEFYEKYKRLFFYILREIFDEYSTKNDFEEDLVNDCFLYLLENNAKRLSKFKGEKEGVLTYYIIKIARRFFIRNKSKYQNMLFSGYDEVPPQDSEETSSHDGDITEIADDDNMINAIHIDEAWTYIERILDFMPNQRYAKAIRIYYTNGYDDNKAATILNINIDNWYMLKKRAIRQLNITHKKNKVLWQNIVSQIS